MVNFDFSAKKIFYVDPDLPSAESARVAFRGAECDRFYWSANVQDALSTIDGYKPDLVLVSYQMADGNAVSLIEEIRARAGVKHVPIMLVFAQKPSEFALKAACKVGLHGIVRKPFDAQKLVRISKTVLMSPRRFVFEEGYFGPERRFDNDDEYAGVDRRAHEEGDEAPMGAWDGHHSSDTPSAQGQWGATPAKERPRVNAATVLSTRRSSGAEAPAVYVPSALSGGKLEGVEAEPTKAKNTSGDLELGTLDGKTKRVEGGEIDLVVSPSRQKTSMAVDFGPGAKQNSHLKNTTENASPAQDVENKAPVQPKPVPAPPVVQKVEAPKPVAAKATAPKPVAEKPVAAKPVAPKPVAKVDAEPMKAKPVAPSQKVIAKPAPVKAPVAKPTAPQGEQATSNSKPVATPPIVPASTPVAEAKPVEKVEDEVETVDVTDALANHKLWVNTGGKFGTRASLKGADLRGEELAEFDFTSVDLPNANLSATNCVSTVFRKANLAQANMSGAMLSSSDLAVSRLRGADLRNAKLDRAVLRGADLSGANLSGASMIGVDLGGANLQGTNLCGANLTNAKGVNPDQIAKAKTDATTKLPLGPGSK